MEAYLTFKHSNVYVYMCVCVCVCVYTQTFYSSYTIKFTF